MKKIYFFLSISGVILLFLSTSNAKDITDFTDTSTDYYAKMNNNYFGAKASGMGRSFIAVADDPSAFYFNPPGLTQLKRTELYLNPPGIAFIKPYRRFATGICVQRLVNYNYDNLYKDEVSITGFTIPVSFQIFSNLYIGGAINFLWKARGISYLTTPSFENDFHTEEEITESGSSFSNSFGILFKPFPKVNFGFVSTNKTKIEWKTEGPNWELTEPNPTIRGSDTLPSSLGFGIVVNFLPKLLVSVDIVRENWSEAKRIEKDREINPSLKDVTAIRIGGEHIITFKKKNIPIRFGLYTEPDYVSDSSDEEQMFLTIGTGYQFYQGFVRGFGFDIAIMDSHLLSSGSKKETRRDIAVFYKW